MHGSFDHNPLIRDHRRQWRDCLYVYPVISRRSKGLSIGVNLNPDKQCNCACVYCQIDRHVERNLHVVDLPTLREELALALSEAASGRLWQEGRFAAAAPDKRRINDIAFSGDGEPTCVGEFDQAVEIAAEEKRAAGLPAVKIVVITNASQLDRPQVQQALPTLDANNGEIWAKLDTGTEVFFQRVNRPAAGLTLRHIVGNIAAVARRRPIVIQTLMVRLDGQPPPEAEVAAYIGQLKRILAAEGKLKLIQLHTIARPPMEGHVSALGDGELDAIARRIRGAIRRAPVEVYYGRDLPPLARGPLDA
jgi:wyosine [tRNA(Phe)-imidazoG37] synthetase (radical SAM superfamily)